MSIRKRVDALEQSTDASVDLEATAAAMRAEGRDVHIYQGQIVEIVGGRKWINIVTPNAVVSIPDNGRDG